MTIRACTEQAMRLQNVSTEVELTKSVPQNGSENDPENCHDVAQAWRPPVVFKPSALTPNGNFFVTMSIG